MTNIPANNPYILSEEGDRLRLETQTQMFVDYLQRHATAFIGDEVGNILDLGCGDGQLGLVLHQLYPAAHIVGIDKDDKAIAKAQQAAQQAGAHSMEYVLGDVQQGLPDGPFDLVYASMVLQHVPDTDTLIANAYQRLRPGGHFWAKMADNKVITAYDNPAYQQLMTMFYQAIVKLGPNPYLPDTIDDVLNQHGFSEIRTEYEEYPLGGSTPEGWAMMGITLGLFHNTQKLMAKMNNISESELERMYAEVVNDASQHRNKAGVQTFRNTIARKPALEAI